MLLLLLLLFVDVVVVVFVVVVAVALSFFSMAVYFSVVDTSTLSLHFCCGCRSNCCCCCCWDHSNSCYDDERGGPCIVFDIGHFYKKQNASHGRSGFVDVRLSIGELVFVLILIKTFGSLGGVQK